MSSLQAAGPATIIAGFPHPVVTKIIGRPTFSQIQKFNKKLKANAASVPTTLGGGLLGHLGLLLTPAEYATVTNAQFMFPVNPGLGAEVPQTSTAAQTGHLVRTHQALKHTYDTCVNVETALKQQIIHAVENAFISALENEHTGYNAVTAKQIMDHLFTTCGQISNEAMEDNDKTFKKQFDIDEPIENLWMRVKHCVQFAEQGQAPYSAEQILRNVKRLFEQKGVFEIDLREFENLPIAQQTYATFKDRMTKAYDKYQERQKLTTAAGGYHTAHATLMEQLDNVTETTIQQINNMGENTNQAITELANAAQTDRTKIDTLTTLVQQQQTLLQKILEQQPTAPVITTHWNNNKPFSFYCHTHGYGTNPKHTSATCNRPGPNHDKTATAKNTKGGNTRFQRRYNQNKM